jgi:hypothetical protein
MTSATCLRDIPSASVSANPIAEMRERVRQKGAPEEVRDVVVPAHSLSPSCAVNLSPGSIRRNIPCDDEV